MNAAATIWTPQGEICRQCGRLVGGIIDRAKRLRASLGNIFAQGSFVKAGGEVVKPLAGGVGAGVVGDTADCGVCPCAGGGSAPTCDCGTCSSATTTRGAHLLGFDGDGVCRPLSRRFNYYKVLGTIDVSDSLPFLYFDPGPPCGISWGQTNLQIPSGLTAYYYRDAICTIPENVASGHPFSAFIITRIFIEYACDIFNPTTQLRGPGWVAAFDITDNQFFLGTITVVYPNPTGACQDGVTIPAPLPSSALPGIGSGSFIVAAV